MPPRPVASRSSHLPLVALAVLVACAGAETFRVGFFGDDFHLLDVARRVPLLEALTGRHGIYPWYRPLSRELYYAVLAAAGDTARPLAHLLQLAALLGATWTTYRLGERLASARAGAIAAALFVSYGFTRFLVAWSAGLQDLLAVWLTLLAVLEAARGRHGRALVAALLAPLAKETGFVAAPLVLLLPLARPDARRPLRAHAPLVAAWLAVAALHVLVRLGWHSGGTSAYTTSAPTPLAPPLLGVFAAFVQRAPVLTAPAIGLALGGGLAAAWLVARAARTDGGALRGPATFAALAAALGLAPLVVGALAHVTVPLAYHGFPAAPWLTLLAAFALERVPAFVPRLAVPALVAWNLCGLGWAKPDLDTDAAWTPTPWSWREAVRLSAVADRLGDDLRLAVGVRAESTVVLYSQLPVGSLFQTEDGPATREVLRDPTVTGRYLQQVAEPVRSDRVAILTFDTVTHHLVVPPRERRFVLESAAIALARGEPWRARTILDWAGEAAHGWWAAYLLSASTLATELSAPGATDRYALRMQYVAGNDTSGEAPRITARDVGGRPEDQRALEALLRSPRSADAHAAYGAGRAADGDPLAQAIELRIALALDPDRAADRLVLAGLMEQVGEPAAAREEYEELLRRSPAGAEAHAARARLAALASAARP